MEEIVIRENLVDEAILRELGNRIASWKRLGLLGAIAVCMFGVTIWHLAYGEYGLAVVSSIFFAGMCFGTVYYSKKYRKKIAKTMKKDLGEQNLKYDVFLNDEGIGVGVCGRNERANYIPFEMIKSVWVTRRTYTLISHSRFFYVIRKDRIDALGEKNREYAHRILSSL